MNKKTIIFTSLVFLLIALVFIFFNLMNIEVVEDKAIVERIDIDINEELILFNGSGCEYCSIVDTFVEENDLEAKTPLQVKEIYFDDENLNEFDAKFNNCNPKPPFRGVPLLWHGGFCLMGEQEIVDYLSRLIN